MRQFCFNNWVSPLTLLIVKLSIIWPRTASLLQYDALFILKWTAVFNLFWLICNCFLKFEWNQGKSKIHVVWKPLNKIDSIGPELARFTEVSTDGFKVQLLSINFRDNRAKHNFFQSLIDTVLHFSNFLRTDNRDLLKPCLYSRMNKYLNNNLWLVLKIYWSLRGNLVACLILQTSFLHSSSSCAIPIVKLGWLHKLSL